MNIGFIGIGSMGGAIAQRLISEIASPRGYASILKHSEIYVSSKSGTTAEQFTKLYGGHAVPTATAGNCDIVILAVKPQQLQEVSALVSKEALVISLAAGVTLNDLTRAYSPRVVRAMPNIGASVGESMTALAPAPAVTSSELDIVQAIFSTVGATQVIPEAVFPAFTAVASCSLAWNCEYLEGLTRGAVAAGMRKSDAIKAAAMSMRATAALLLADPELPLSPALLIDKVCSPGGTTIAGLNAATAAGLSNAATNAVTAACERDSELNK